MPNEKTPPQHEEPSVKKDGKTHEEKEKKASKVHIGGGFNVNLGGGFIEHRTSGGVNVENVLLGTLCVTLSLALLGYGGALWYLTAEKEKTGVVLEKIHKVNGDIASIEKKQTELSAFQNRLGSVKGALENHTFMTQLFAKLEEYTLPTVFYTNVSVAPNMSVNLTGEAGSYTEVGKQLLAFQEAKDIVASAKIEGANAVIGQQGEILGINFLIKIEFKPTLVKRKAQEDKSDKKS